MDRFRFLRGSSKENFVSLVTRRPEGELIARTNCSCQLKTWATTLKEDAEPPFRQQIFGYARWSKDCVKVSGEFAQNHRASVRDVVRSIGDAALDECRYKYTS